MDASDLKRGANVRYKLKISGRWTPYLRYVGETRTAFVFKTCDRTNPVGLFQTYECHLVPKPLRGAIREFVRCKPSGVWRKAPRACGRDW